MTSKDCEDIFWGFILTSNLSWFCMMLKLRCLSITEARKKYKAGDISRRELRNALITTAIYVFIGNGIMLFCSRYLNWF